MTVYLNFQESTMNESEIRGLIDQVRDNGISRKQFIRHMIGAGLTVGTKMISPLIKPFLSASDSMGIKW